MKKFNTVKDFLNHIPNCLICGKELTFHISGYSFNDKFRLKFSKLENKLHSLGKKYTPVSIDLDKNEFINGKGLFGKLRHVFFYKECRTCAFYIRSNTNCNLKFIQLEYCGLSWFEKNKKKIELSIDYTGSNWNEIKINDKHAFVPLEIFLNFDLSKFKNKKELYSRIKTIITFS